MIDENTEKTDVQAIPNPAFIGKGLIEELKAAYLKKGGLSNAFKVSANSSSWSPVTSTYISDNGGYPDLAVGEIKVNLADIHAILTTLSGKTPPQRIYHDIPSQDWRAGAFDLAQLSRYRLRGAGNTFFVNCAPRLAQRGVDGNNKGEDVYLGMLPNGAIISGVSPHSFAFFRDLVEEGKMEIYKVNVQTEGSQFRSRDFFPWFSEILTYNLSEKHEGWKEGLSVEQRREFLKQFDFIDTDRVLDLHHIPDMSRPQIARTDVHGNLKLSISASDAKPEWSDRILDVTIKNKTHKAVLKDCMFDPKSEKWGLIPEKNRPRIGLAAGSSGDFSDSSKDDPPFLELSILGVKLLEDIGITDKDLRDGVFVEIEPEADPALNIDSKHDLDDVTPVGRA